MDILEKVILKGKQVNFKFQYFFQLFKAKAQLKGEESVKDDTVGQAFMEKYVLGLFKKADDDDRAARFSRF